jgi:hypothetical protein
MTRSVQPNQMDTISYGTSSGGVSSSQRQLFHRKDGSAVHNTIKEHQPQHHHQQQNDTVGNNANTATSKGCVRMILWFVAIVLVVLQLMIANIIYKNPTEHTQRIEQYPILNFGGENQPMHHRGRRAAIVISNRQRRQQTVVSSTDIQPPKENENGNLYLRTNAYNFAEHVNFRNDIDAAKSGIHYNGMDPILYPILKAGRMYSICRGDRSGSVIADMIYAHAFAFAHNITYAGNCCVTRGLPKEDTRNLIHTLHWHTIIPFRCPAGVNNKKYNVLKPNATTISPLILNPDVYRLQGHRSNFKPKWRQSVQKELYKYTDHRPDRPFYIAVHVRRGDVTPCTYKRRYLPNSHYLALIDQYTPNATSLNGRPVVVTIYSESDTYEPFDVFRQRNYKLELDTENLAHVWKALSTADVAILSRSYFSIVPAAINPNTVVATEFFDFDVRVMDGWEHADTALVKESDELIRQIYVEHCNNTKVSAS